MAADCPPTCQQYGPKEGPGIMSLVWALEAFLRDLLPRMWEAMSKTSAKFREVCNALRGEKK